MQNALDRIADIRAKIAYEEDAWMCQDGKCAHITLEE